MFKTVFGYNLLDSIGDDAPASDFLDKAGFA